MALVINGWDNTTRAHVVNLIAVLKDSAVFMDSVVVGEINQPAVAQAELVEQVLKPYGGVDAFAVAGNDNTASCINIMHDARHCFEESLWNCKPQRSISCSESGLIRHVQDALW